jgi:hypothetical protein
VAWFQHDARAPEFSFDGNIGQWKSIIVISRRHLPGAFQAETKVCKAVPAKKVTVEGEHPIERFR